MSSTEKITRSNSAERVGNYKARDRGLGHRQITPATGVKFCEGVVYKGNHHDQWIHRLDQVLRISHPH
jgi:hypothetical protein